MAATATFRLFVKKTQPLILSSTKAAVGNATCQVRNITFNESGSILPKPPQVRLGLIKIALTVTPFLLCGAQISKEFAAWLEENDLFVPDDDDD